MIKRSRLIALLAPLGLLVPAGAGAATHGGSILVAGPVRVHAYRMYLVAEPGSRRAGDNLLVVFARGTNRRYQSHIFSFTHGVSVKVAKGGGAATVRGNLGSYGKVNLRLALGGGHLSLPAGCHGASAAEHFGRVSGGLTIRTHNRYFGTVHKASLPAFTTVVRGTLSCAPKPTHPARGVAELATSALSAGGNLTSLIATHDARGHVTEGVTVTQAPTGPAAPAIIHGISESGLPAGDFTYASDLSSAQVTGPGPYLTGRLSFTRTISFSANSAAGSVGGNLAAHFDGLPIAFPARGPLQGSLSR